MGINKQECYTVDCDGCGIELGETGDYIPHFSSEKAAIEQATDINDEDWLEMGEELFCPDCKADKICMCCGKEGVNFPKICDDCQNKEDQEEIKSRLERDGEILEQWQCKTCGMLYGGSQGGCSYCNDQDPCPSLIKE